MVQPLEIFEVDLALAEEDPANPRFEIDKDDDLLLLGQSLLVNQDYPIILKPHASLAGSFTLVDGHRRTRAARRVGLKTLKAYLVKTGLSEAEIRAIQFRTDFQKKHLSPYERSMLVIGMLKDNPNLTGTHLAALLGMEESLLSKYLQAQKLSDDAMEAYRLGKLGLKDMLEVVKSVDQASAVDDLQSGKTSNDLRRERQEQEAERKPVRSGKPAPSNKSAQTTGRKPKSFDVPASGLIVSFTGEGVSIEAAMTAATAALHLMKAAKEAHHDVTTFRTWLQNREKDSRKKEPVNGEAKSVS